jgi:hypothetical protein
MVRLALMTDALQSARTKLARANLHAGTAKREATRFIDKHPSPPVEIKLKTELQAIPIGALVDFDIVFGEGPAFPDLPDSFSARFGDAIQNYRSALDHLAWQLVKHGTNPNPKNPTAVQFPIYANEGDFHSQLATRLPGVDRGPGGPCKFIESRHRYEAGKARNDVLLQLMRLSNDDKHRSLHAMVTALGRGHHQITFTDCRHTSFRDPPEPPRLKPGAVIAHLTIVITGANPEMEVEPNLSAYVALEGWANAMDILIDTRREVTEILNAPEILRAL